MGEGIKEKISGPKLLSIIGMLYIFLLGVNYFLYPSSVGCGIIYCVPATGFNFILALMLLIFCLVIALLIFISSEFINFGSVKIPFRWWIILIFGIVLALFAVFFGGNFLPAILLLLAALIEVIMKKKPYKASKIALLVGIGFSLYDCVVLRYTPLNPLNNYIRNRNVVTAIFGLILIILLLLRLFDAIHYSWWLVLPIGFVILTWVSTFAYAVDFDSIKAPIVGFGGTIILIAFLLVILEL